MLHIDLRLDAVGQFEELDGVAESTGIKIGGLVGGLASGAPSVVVELIDEDGTPHFAQTSLALLLTAADGLTARYGDPRQDQRVDRPADPDDDCGAGA